MHLVHVGKGQEECPPQKRMMRTTRGDPSRVGRRGGETKQDDGGDHGKKQRGNAGLGVSRLVGLFSKLEEERLLARKREKEALLGLMPSPRRYSTSEGFQGLLNGH
jgi:hypothetical protein